MMLPGVEVARRRRVRAGQGREGAYEGGVSRSETHRSRLGVTGAHHLSRLGSTPVSSRPQALLRMQENLHEQHSDSSSSSSAAAAATIIISRSNSLGDTENFKADNHHHRSREESRGTKFTNLWRRQSSCSHTDPSGLAVEARYRLDDLLQAVDNHGTQTSSSRRNLAARQHTAQSPEHSTGFIYVNSRRTSSSVYGWLAGLATCVQSVKQCLNRVEVTSRPSRSSTTTTTLSSSSPDQRRTMIRALRMPREVVDGPVQDDCPVCLEALMTGEATITLLCNHTFHPQCLTPWLSRDDKCPCCRTSITRHKHISHELKSRTLPGRDEDFICSRGSKLLLKEMGTKAPNCLTVNVQPSPHRH